MTEITKADRDAARSHDPFLWEMKPRSHEFQSLIQAFARHRMEATKDLIAQNERLRNALSWAEKVDPDLVFAIRVHASCGAEK